MTESEKAKIPDMKGWNGLIEWLVRGLGDEVEVVQVKEKFGGLRFCAENLTAHEAQRILVAEVASATVCQECGTTLNISTGTLYPGSFWVMTLCGDCRHHLRKQENQDEKEEAQEKTTA